MANKNKVILILISVIFFYLLPFKKIFSQQSCSPADGYSDSNNSIEYDEISKIVRFKYTSSEKSFEFRFDLKKGGHLGAIEIDDSKSNSFLPSNAGGISITGKNYSEEIHPWTKGVKFDLIKITSAADSLLTLWDMNYGVLSFKYEMKFSFMHKTLKINFKEVDRSLNSAECSSVYLDRCEMAKNPYIIGIPYLTNFNILFSNNNFTSLFFDWEKTNCSIFQPYNNVYSQTSVYFSQLCKYYPDTKAKRNSLDETLYLSYSENLDEVLPNLPVTSSLYKDASSQRIIFDYTKPFNTCKRDLDSVLKMGIKNIWLIVHNWQRAGYDVELPYTYPANPKFGGDQKLIELSDFCRENDVLFSLHENYSDLYPNPFSFNQKDIAKDKNKDNLKAWNNGLEQSFLLKPSKILKYMLPISSEIHRLYKTNASYLDVHSSYDPSKYVDYDANSNGAAKYSTPLKYNRSAGTDMQKIHGGPVSGEGLAHFLYAGYYDDFCAQIHTAQNFPPVEKTGGFYRPLLVDFDLLKMHSKTSVHGVGYYERFFYKDVYWKYMGRSLDSALMYLATELAYGHCSYFSSSSYNYFEHGSIEYKYLFPFQKQIAETEIDSIMYSDGENFYTISDYIRKYPSGFADIDNKDFLSRVKLKYKNGIVVYVNRNNFNPWDIFPEAAAGGSVSYHSIEKGKNVLYIGNEQVRKKTLAPKSGWLIFKPE